MPVCNVHTVVVGLCSEWWRHLGNENDQNNIF